MIAMIAIIGTMIGAYIITKMLWIIGLQEQNRASLITKNFCVITIMVAIVGIILLMGSLMEPSMEPYPF